MHATLHVVLDACERRLATSSDTPKSVAQSVLTELGMMSFRPLDVVCHCLESEFADREFWAGEFASLFNQAGTTAADCAGIALDSYVEHLQDWFGGDPDSWVSEVLGGRLPMRREFTLWHHVQTTCAWWGVDCVNESHGIAKVMLSRLLDEAA